MTIIWKRISEARYNEMLGCVPPIYSAIPKGCSDGFLVGEAWDHNEYGVPRFAPFMRIGSEFYEGSEPMTTADFASFKVFTMEVK